jgi:hypothetical protein
VPSEDVPKLTETLAEESILAYEIGKATERDDGLKICDADGVRDLPMFPRDELARWFGD